MHAYFNVYPVWLADPDYASPPPDNTVPLHPFWAWSDASNWSYWRYGYDRSNRSYRSNWSYRPHRSNRADRSHRCYRS